MISVAVIGAKGYIGSALCSALYRLNVMTFPIDVNKLIAVIPIVRETYKAAKEGKYHILINCAMPGSRYWANNNLEKDYIETVEKTQDIVNNWYYNKIIQISTISVRSDPTSIYAQHKAEAEEICRTKSNSLIYRLTSTYSPTLTRGILIDMFKGKVFANGENKYAFSSLDFVTNWIATHLDRFGLIELGAKNTISLQEIADHLKLKVEFDGISETQDILNPESDYPDVKEVLTFMENYAKKM